MLVKLEWLGYRTVKKLWQYVQRSAVFIQYQRVTDGRTDRIAISISRARAIKTQGLDSDGQTGVTSYGVLGHVSPSTLASLWISLICLCVNNIQTYLVLLDLEGVTTGGSIFPYCWVPWGYLWLVIHFNHFTCVSRAEERPSYRLDVCLSVRLSVTRWYSIKTAERIVMIFSPHDSPFILVFTADAFCWQ